jgi:hypothetical protein
MKILSVKNFETYQHYKNRNPPWVKLYYSILDDPDFIALEEVDRYRYIMCILIASRQNNVIPNDPTYLARVMRLTGEVDVTPLIRAGFLLAPRRRDASKPIERHKQDVLSETEIEAETDKEAESCDEFSRVWEVYPRKVGKEAARKAWERTAKDRPHLDTLLNAIISQKKSHQWTKDNGQFIPHFATWLNQHRWLDEVTILQRVPKSVAEML